MQFAVHPLYRATHIGRPIEPKYPTNLWILIVMVCAGALFAGLSLGRHAGAGGAAAAGGTAAVVAFLAWALGRELAPDENPSAFLAVAVALLVLHWQPDADLLLLGVTLLLVRVVNRTVGPPAKYSDLVMVEALVAYAVLGRGEWALGLVAAVAFAGDASLDEPQGGGIVFAVIALALAIYPALGAFRVLLQFETVVRSATILGAAAVIAAAYLVVVTAQPPLVAPCDLRDAPPNRSRVRFGMLVALLAAAQSLLYAENGFYAALPLWTTLLAIVAGRMVLTIGRW